MVFDPDDFLHWMISPDGQRAEQAIFEVQDALKGAFVDPLERTIIWIDRARLSIQESARRITSQSDLSFDRILSHVISWLQMHYVPPDFNEKQMEKFEQLVDNWIAASFPNDSF